MIYLDSSALAKLIVKEVESTALRAWLDERPGPLRPFDALHVVSAKRLGHALETLVSYDKRMLSVAEQLGLPVAAPGAS